MPTLNNYAQFGGAHWVTGTIHNALAHAGYTAPHTNQPYSEALLMGVSGGLAFGYFSFHYEGTDPHVSLITRNTFNNYGWDAITERLGIVQNILQTGSMKKAKTNLVDALDNGQAPIVWADHYTLPYNVKPYDEGMWAMQPVIVYGYDADSGAVHIADRAHKSLETTSDMLEQARARVKKDKFRIITLDDINPEKLSSAVQRGIWDCIALYTEKPPKGSKNNFGFAAYERWAELLTHAGAKQSWAKFFPAGRYWYNGLTSAFEIGLLYGQGDSLKAERDVFADFLEEAATILEKPEFSEIAVTFRKSGDAWTTLGDMLLPTEVPILAETRHLLIERHTAFINQPDNALEIMQKANTRIEEIRSVMENDFPLSASEVAQVQEKIAAQVMVIHDIEHGGITALQAVMD